MYVCMYVWMDEWMNKWMDEWMNGWMDEGNKWLLFASWFCPLLWQVQTSVEQLFRNGTKRTNGCQGNS